MLMKAIAWTRYGSPDVLEFREMEKPSPKAGEVLVRVHAAPVTRADTMMRTGTPYFGRLMLGFTKPKYPVPGTGFAGQVEALGEGVDRFQTGDRVFGETTVHFGAHAEYVCVPADGIIARLPDHISYEEAAPVSDGALTALNFLKKIGRLRAGQKVLINGASGSIGTAAVQLAKQLGADVTGVTSTRNLGLVRSLGADQVVDYTQEDFTRSGKQYDLIFDTVGKSSFGRSRRALTQNGAYLSPVLSFPLLLQMFWTAGFSRRKAKFSATGLLPPAELRTLLEELRDLLAAGRLKTVIDKRYTLEQIPDAHRYVDEGHKRGSVVVKG